MRQMRARAFALRDVFPDVLRGMPVAEEVMDTPTKEMGHADVVGAHAQAQAQGRAELPAYAQADFEKNLSQWRGIIQSGRKTPDQLIAMVEKKGAGLFTDAQRQAMHNLAAHPADDVTDVTPKDAPTTSAAEQESTAEFLAGLEG